MCPTRFLMPTFVFSDICFARKRSHALCFYKGADSRSFCVYHKRFVLGKFSFFPKFTRIIANKAEITRLPVSPLRSRKVIGSNSTSGTVCTSHLFTTWQVYPLHHPPLYSTKSPPDGSTFKSNKSTSHPHNSLLCIQTWLTNLCVRFILKSLGPHERTHIHTPQPHPISEKHFRFYWRQSVYFRTI